MEKEHRELYRRKYQAQMDEWSARVGEMRAHNEQLSATAKIEAQSHMDTVHRKYETVKSRLHEMADATDDKWEEVKRTADEAWTDFKSAVEGAYETIKARAQARSTTQSQSSPAETQSPRR